MRLQGDAELRTAITTCQDDLGQEKTLRGESEAEIRKDLQGLDGRLAKAAAELRSLLDEEAKKRGQGDDGLAARIAELQKLLEAETASRNQGDAENKNSLQIVQGELGGDLRNLTGAQQNLDAAVKALQDGLTAEQAARTKGDGQLYDQVKDLYDKLGQEEAKRIQGDKDLDDANVAQNRAVEQQIGDLRKADEGLQGKLDQEAALRQTADEDTKAFCNDMIGKEVADLKRSAVKESKRLDGEIGQRGQGDDELKGYIIGLKKELDDEKKMRAEQDEQFAAELNAAHTNHEAECVSRAKNMQDFHAGFKKVMDNAGTEAKRPVKTRSNTQLVAGKAQ